MLNAMTVDLEDWAQAVVDPAMPISDRILANTERVLKLLDRCRVRATFFALGRACEQYPQLLPMVASAGHEIASHGYGHQLVYNLTPEQFAADLKRSIEIIEAQTGQRPMGYRAPAFSITRRSLWAGPILAEMGFTYSSSIFPIRKKRYGIPDWPQRPSEWPSCRLVEFPMTTLSLFGRALPVCGGGYTRLLPAAVHAEAIRRRNAEGHPAVVYLHPYELAVGEVAQFMRNSTRASVVRKFMQELWRTRVEPRLSRLFEEFSFGHMREALAGRLHSSVCGCSGDGEGCKEGAIRGMRWPLQPAGQVWLAK